MVIFHSYVSLPEGKHWFNNSSKHCQATLIPQASRFPSVAHRPNKKRGLWVPKCSSKSPFGGSLPWFTHQLQQVLRICSSIYQSNEKHGTPLLSLASCRNIQSYPVPKRHPKTTGEPNPNDAYTTIGFPLVAAASATFERNHSLGRFKGRPLSLSQLLCLSVFFSLHLEFCFN